MSTRIQLLVFIMQRTNKKKQANLKTLAISLMNYALPQHNLLLEKEGLLCLSTERTAYTLKIHSSCDCITSALPFRFFTAVKRHSCPIVLLKYFSTESSLAEFSMTVIYTDIIGDNFLRWTCRLMFENYPFKIIFVTIIYHIHAHFLGRVNYNALYMWGY